jgi:DNA-binding protein HU-beta
MQCLTLEDAIGRVAVKSDVPLDVVRRVLQAQAEVAHETAAKGFPIPGIGYLLLVQRAARAGRNPATGERIQIPAKLVAKFRVAQVAKRAIIGRSDEKAKILTEEVGDELDTPED